MVTLEKLAIVVVAFAVPLAGCGEKSPSVAPSSIAPSAPASVAPQQIEGTIDGLGPSAIAIGGRSIVVDRGAAIRSGSLPLTFSDLRVGARARVLVRMDGGAAHTAQVDVMDDVGAPAQFHGTISALSRDGDLFQFRLGGQLVRGDGATEVVDEQGGGTRALGDGMMVALDALQRAEYAYGRRIAIERQRASSPPSSTPAPAPAPTPAPTPTPTPAPTPAPAPAPSPTPNETTIGGVLGSVSGVCPVTAFPVDGRVVVTSSSTAFVGGSCSSLAAGGSVEVTGTPNGNVVVARQVTIR